MTIQSSRIELVARDLGRMPYPQAHALQKQVQAEVIAHRDLSSASMQLLLVEHDPPVITVSRRPGAQRHLLANEAQLRRLGVEVCQTDRGGDITYHGPGQLVVYPILDLNRLNLRLTSYLRFLEQIIIDVLSEFGIAGQRDACATGVWVPATGAQPPREQRLNVSNGQACTTAEATAKIAAIGVRVSRWVSMHGLALNVTTNLDHFNLIVPCGLTGRAVTSMQRELGPQCPSMDEVKRAMVSRFEQAVSLTP